MILFGKSKKKLLEQLAEAEDLIGSLESFLFVARTDKPKSIAVKWVQNEVDAYRRRWK